MGLTPDAVDRIANTMIKSIEAFNESQMAPLKMQYAMAAKQYENQQALAQEEAMLKVRAESGYKYDPIKRAQMQMMANEAPESASEFERFGIKPTVKKPPVLASGEAPQGMSTQEMAQKLNAPNLQQGLSPLDGVINNIYTKAIQGQPISKPESEMIIKAGKPPMEIMAPLSGKIIRNPEYDVWVKNQAKGTSSAALGEVAVAVQNGQMDLPTAHQVVAQRDPQYYDYLKGVNEGRINVVGRGSAAMAKILGDVALLYPDFDQSVYSTRLNTRKDFTSGMTSRNIKAINTAVRHLDEMYSIADKMDNKKIAKYNSLANYLKSETSNPTIAKAKMIHTALTGELAAIFKATGATDAEIENMKNSIDLAQSKESLKAVMQEAILLMEGRSEAIEDQWGNTFGQGNRFGVLANKSQDIINKVMTGPQESEEGKVKSKFSHLW